MRTTVKGKNLEVPDADRRYAEHKLARLGRLLDDRTDAVVELSHERHRDVDDSYIVEVTLLIDGRLKRAVSHAATYQAAIDDVVDKIGRQSVDHRERPRARRASDGQRVLLNSLADGTTDQTPDRPQVVKVKRFAIEPMFEEDAVSRMEELGHSFFVFVNAENERLAVLYRRNDGNYGLIEPVVGGMYTSGGRDRDRGR